MESLPLIKLAIDLALSGTIFYLALRVGRKKGLSDAQVHSLQMLEESLSHLLREAGGASRELQQALKKEQKKLEELLFDIETVEHRVNKGVDEAQVLHRELKRTTQSSASPAREAPRQQQQMVQVKADYGHGAQYTEEELENFDQITPAPYIRKSPEQEPSTSRNVYGEPLQAASNTQAYQYEAAQGSLRDAIEQEVTPTPQMKSPPPGIVQKSLEDIYAECEELLRAGRSLQQVASSMNLSVDEIETLQRVMMVDDEPEGMSRNETPESSALGVLSPKKRSKDPIGRSTQVIS